MKKEHLCTLALPVLLFIISCSHLPQGTAESGAQSQSTVLASAPAAVEPAVPQPTAEAKTPAPEGSAAIRQNASQTSVAEAPKPPPTAKASAQVPECPADVEDNPSDLIPPECAPGDTECDASAKLQPAEKESQAVFEEALDFCDVAQSQWEKGEIDNALESLDKAYSLIFEVDAQQNPKLMQQKEDLRILIAKRILEIYASRSIAVRGGHNEIPMEHNADIDAELKLFTEGVEKDLFLRAYQRSGRYRPYILQALKEAGLPEELSWLPLIESAFKVKAFSPARALGLWQFIPSTGYKFGLKRNNYIDERIDFVKSTQAAIAYLKELHNLFGDWSTVLAAYNCGEGRVLQVIRSQNINYLDNFWDLYQRLPRETARYVPRFFATLQVVKHPERYGLDKIELEPPMVWEEVRIDRQVHLKEISNVLGIGFDELEMFNPELRYHILPPESYRLRIPKGKSELLLASLDSLPTCILPSSAARTYIRHMVRRGETLAGIARRYGVSSASILRTNRLKRASSVRAGLSLKIPVRDVPEVTAGRRTIESSGIHVVSKGDTLFNISKRYHTTVQQISDLNHLNSGASLKMGQKLKIPGAASETPAGTVLKAKSARPYFARKGDTITLICRKHHIPMERFLEINGLTPASKLRPGQKLLLE